MDSVRNRSQFEENAANKISDARTHESVITDENITTARSMSSARTITEKLSEYKHETINNATADHGNIGEFRTETEIHGLVDPEKPTDNTITAQQSIQPSQVMIPGQKIKETGEKHQSGTGRSGNVSAKYNSALRNERADPEPHVRSSTYKGGQMRYGLSETGSSDPTGKYAASQKNTGTSALERLKSYRVSTGTAGSMCSRIRRGSTSRATAWATS